MAAKRCSEQNCATLRNQKLEGHARPPQLEVVIRRGEGLREVGMKETSVILLVENNKDYIYLLEQGFRNAHIRNPLKIARYGSEAILYLKGIGIYQDRRIYPLPALILLDMTNPDGSSMALLGWIREQSHFDSVPVLVLTCKHQESEVQNALDRGANAFIIKRESLSDLISTIHSIELPDESTRPARKAALAGSMSRSAA